MQQYAEPPVQGKKRLSQPEEPVLTEEDEAFLQRVPSESTNGESMVFPEQPAAHTDPLVTAPIKDAQVALMDGAQNIPLPASPVEEKSREIGMEERLASGQAGAGTPVDSSAAAAKKKNRWSWMGLKTRADDKKNKQVSATANLTATPNVPQPPEATASIAEQGEEQREAEDMTDILERLNLAAINNRVFSISDETQELLRKFKLIFKDLVNGVPTAYHDLEMLLTNGNRQLQSTYSELPTFLQKLIEKLPERWTETLAPEILAAASERAGRSGINLENVGKAAAAANKMGLKVPSLKELVGKPAALVGMLRSIMTFLRARFPAVIGMNVLWSLALFLLLFVLWYCHKRGREVRLENERLVTDAEIEQMNEDPAAEATGKFRPTETLTTTAPAGASIEDVRHGMQEAARAREAAAVAAAAAENDRRLRNEHAQESSASATTGGDVASGHASGADTAVPPAASRRKSRFSFWGKKNDGVPPYEGT